MGADSKIAWTDHTFNPWWGCAKVSPGCVNCYAETWAKRTGHDVFGPGKKRRFFGAKHWQEPPKWAEAARAAGKRAKVFCASMCDVLEDGGPRLDVERERLWSLIRATADALDWLLLTKRADRLGVIPDDVARLCWVGVTVEDQQRADERIPALLRVPAKVRFLSCEPLLESVDLSPWQTLRACPRGHVQPECDVAVCECGERVDPKRPALSLVICGGESGYHARPFCLDAARSLLSQCREAGVAFFMKQFGDRPAGLPTIRVDRKGLQIPASQHARAWADPSEWPEDLQVREWPEEVAR